MANIGPRSGRLHSGYARLEGFLRSCAGGVRPEDVRRLFGQEAAQAVSVLTRDQPEPGDERGLARLLSRLRSVLAGLAAKLTPARRLLFFAALLLLGSGLFEVGRQVEIRLLFFGVSSSSLWFLAGSGILIFLLALELVDRVRVRDELEVAQQLQADLLPREAPELPGYRLAHSYRTANEVGGDYYGFPHLPGGRLALMIGDASGHGMAAGLLMAIADATVQTALDLDPEPARVAAILNRALARTGGRRAFMSFFYGVLEPASGRFDYVCAGHPFPLLRRRGGALEELGCGGLPLGLRSDLAPPTGSVVIEPGDLLLLFTDGLAESLDGAGEAFGFERLKRLLPAGGSAAGAHRAILEAFDRHRGEVPLADDLTLVVVERKSA